MYVERPESLQIGKRELFLPIYFPSISSVKTTMRPSDYVALLSSLTTLNGQFLVSAFDLQKVDAPDSIKSLLDSAINSGATILMDSGNYESFWRGSKTEWGQNEFHRILESFPCDIAFCFDNQEPPEDADEHVALLVSRWIEDQKAAPGCMIVPIIHGNATDLPGLCARVAIATGATMVAVAERKLGDGVIERARTIAAIRHELNSIGNYVALHLLGTGNPSSIAIYAVMGADSFDGLEWCQTVVDHDTGLLFHLSQADFFEKQTEWCDAGLSFQARTLAHNLEFYTDWMQRLRYRIRTGKGVDFCRFNLPERIFQQCVVAFQWE